MSDKINGTVAMKEKTIAVLNRESKDDPDPKKREKYRVIET